MKYLKSLSESIEDDTIKSIEYQKYINKLVVFKTKNKLDYGTIMRIFDYNNKNLILIMRHNKPFQSSNYELNSITILKECNSIQEAENYIDMLNNSDKYNL